MAAVEGRDVATTERLHQATERVCPPRGCKQVDLGVEQRVGMDRDAVMNRGVLQQGQIGQAVLLVDKDALPIVATLQQVVQLAGHRQPRRACHTVSRRRMPGAR